MRLSKAVGQFLSGYFATRDRSEKTEKAYACDLEQFARFAGPERPLPGVDPDLVEEWAGELKRRGYAPASIQRKMVALRVFCHYWLRKGLLQDNPFWRVRLSFGRIQQLPRSLTEEEIRALLNEARRAHEAAEAEGALRNGRHPDPRETHPAGGEHGRQGAGESRRSTGGGAVARASETVRSAGVRTEVRPGDGPRPGLEPPGPGPGADAGPVGRSNDVSGVTPRYLALRNYAFLDLLFATGIRVGEAASLTLDSFIEDGRTLRIHGKGRRPRLAFLIDDRSIYLQEEHRRARESIATDTRALFLNAFGDPLSTQGMANVLKKLRSAAGLQRHVTPHMIRHTVATLLLRNGADIRIVQEFLGHASIATTQRYTHITKQHLLAALRTSHPALG